jgi:hypothetical protein
VSAPPDSVSLVPRSGGAASGYVEQMPKLREFAAMRVDDPRRRVLRDELILAFVPVVANLARRHVSSSVTSV